MSEDEMDGEVERILAMSAEELRAKLVAEGIDPDEYARKARELFEEIAASYPPKDAANV